MGSRHASPENLSQWLLTEVKHCLKFKVPTLCQPSELSLLFLSHNMEAPARKNYFSRPVRVPMNLIALSLLRSLVNHIHSLKLGPKVNKVVQIPERLTEFSNSSSSVMPTPNRISFPWEPCCLGATLVRCVTLRASLSGYLLKCMLQRDRDGDFHLCIFHGTLQRRC